MRFPQLSATRLALRAKTSTLPSPAEPAVFASKSDYEAFSGAACRKIPKVFATLVAQAKRSHVPRASTPAPQPSRLCSATSRGNLFYPTYHAEPRRPRAHHHVHTLLDLYARLSRIFRLWAAAVTGYGEKHDADTPSAWTTASSKRMAHYTSGKKIPARTSTLSSTSAGRTSSVSRSKTGSLTACT